MRIESRTDVLADVRQFVSQAAREFGFDEDDVMNIGLAVDEACTNIIKHAYENRPDGWIRIDVRGKTGKKKDEFVIHISDSGKSFDPSTYTAPDMEKYFKKMKRGGLGVFLMKKIMDKVEYASSSPEGNSIRLVKYRTPDTLHS